MANHSSHIRVFGVYMEAYLHYYLLFIDNAFFSFYDCNCFYAIQLNSNGSIVKTLRIDVENVCKQLFFYIRYSYKIRRERDVTDSSTHF